MRILSVLAAAFLVGAFALATLAAPDMPLARALLLLDHHLLVSVQDASLRKAPWLWNRIAVPVLTRPVWFVPAALGLIFAGCAYTAASRHAPRSRRRRS